MQQSPLTGRALCLALAILLSVTWLPFLGFHLLRTKLDGNASGTVLVIFAPGMSQDGILQNVLAANGSLVQRLAWPDNVWLVHSATTGFVQRLENQGAWVSFSPELLSLATIFSCLAAGNPQN